MHRLARWRTLTAMVAVMVALDAGRFGFGLDVLAWLNTAFVWVVIHQLGYFIRDGFATRLGGVGVVGLIVAGVAVLTVLTLAGPYPRSMVAVPGQAFSNIYPTTAAIFAVAVTQLGIILALRDPLNRWLDERRVYRPVVAVNAVIMTIFVWHMTAALLVLAGVRLIGWDLLSEPSVMWWIQRPLWLIVPGVVLLVFVAVFGRFEISRWFGSGRIRY
jgi:hypothetical protein